MLRRDWRERPFEALKYQEVVFAPAGDCQVVWWLITNEVPQYWLTITCEPTAQH